MAKRARGSEHTKKRVTPKLGSDILLEMMLKFRNRRHVDRKRDDARKACRGRVRDDE